MPKDLEDKLEPAAPEGKKPPAGKRLAIVSITALGVVYGDIGTSPLYAIRACFHGAHSVPVNPVNILGVLSLVLWSLVIVISVKYAGYVMRADNRGEGGILALMALIHPADRSPDKKRGVLIAMGIFGAALLYGDGTITPAISVLSAIEGLEVATPFFKPYIIPATVVIILLLFSFQRQGTHMVGSIFGPVMLFWFVLLAVLGIGGLLRRPDALAAINPYYAVRFFVGNGWHAFSILAIVFLAVTGGEVLYADMGHFGRTPIRLAWFSLVLPALLVNYFGQGALLLDNPEAARNPFYMLAPHWGLYPMVVISTTATVIASQAVISGAFSLTRQAIQLGYCPRMRIVHTSREEIGQVYISGINWVLAAATVSLVIGFQKSTNLAGAYGMAVSTTMVITTILAFVVARELWKWSRLTAGAVTILFLIPDLAFFSANLTKLPDGGWFSIAVAALVYVVMSTWNKGRSILWEQLKETRIPIDRYLDEFRRNPPQRVSGTAVFLTGSTWGVPPALLYQLEHNKVLHEQVVLMTIITDNVPYVWGPDRVEVAELEQGFYRVTAHYGFMEEPRMGAILKWSRGGGLIIEAEQASFFVGRENIVPSKNIGMSNWRARFFSLMSRNALQASAFFHVPSNRVIELGVNVEV